ncbi:MAG TPA: TonB-dependent receptor [Caulobacteraceae bacterium]|nr:TonB-dependent receptor [Caulobacteraceae bacterium]
MSFTHRLWNGAALAVALAAPSLTRAAEAQTQSAAAPTTIGEIVVTAERRAEDIQRVPIAITAIQGAALDTQGINGFEDLSMRVPSLRFGAGVTGGENVITMRGLGSQNTTPGGDSPVAYNLDGVYLQRTTVIDPEFYDINRIEVLRGPQGTLYGRNSVGGSVNVITNKPTDAFEAGADALIGNYQANIFRGFISGPIYKSGDFAIEARLTGVRATHSGYSTNLSTAPTATHNEDAQDYSMLRGQLKFIFGPNVDFLLEGVYSSNKDPAAFNVAWWETPNRFVVNNGDPGQPPIALGSACDFSTAASYNPRVFCHNSPDTASNDVHLYSGTLNWRMAFATLTSVTAWSSSNVQQLSDGDGSDLPVAIGAPWTLKQSQFSQEVRLASPDTPRALRWLVGFIYFYADNYEDFGYRDTGYNDIFPIPGGLDEFTFLSHGVTKTKSYAPFGQIDYDLGQTSLGIPLTVTAGLRYTHDEKYGYNYLDYELPVFCGGPCSISQGQYSASWGQVTGKFGLQYQVSHEVMAYASVSRGYLSGGNIVGLAHVYGPETMWSWEGGVKTRFLDDRLQFNLAGYYERINGLQVFVQSSTESGINNVNGATDVKGLEAEVAAVPIDNLRLNLAVTLTDAHYGRYITTDTRFAPTFDPGPECFVDTSKPLVPAPSYLCNFQGHALNETPPYTVDFGVEYAFHTALGTFTPRIDAFWSGRVQFLPDNWPTSVQKPYHETDAHLTWTSPAGRYFVEGFIKNIENANVISNDGLQSISLGQQSIEPDNFVFYPPRTYGVRIGVNFGG